MEISVTVQNRGVDSRNSQRFLRTDHFLVSTLRRPPIRESWEHCGVDLNLILSLQMGIMCKMTLDSLLTFLSLKLATGQSHSPPDLEAEVIPSAHTYLEHWTSSFHWELMKAMPGLSGYPELSKQHDSSPLSLPVLWVHDTSELLSLGLWLD